MPNRRRGKSVVLDSLPSLVTTGGESNALPRTKPKKMHVNKETIREIIIVLLGLVFVVWIFFGGQKTSKKELSGIDRVGSRPMQFSDSPFIVPAHLGGLSGNRDGVKKAPGDKQKSGAVEAKTSKKQNEAIFKFTGSHSPSLVIVTVVDDIKKPRDYIEKIIENRIEYAQAHNYGVLIKAASDLSKYWEESHNHQSSWARVALSLEAQISFPNAKWIWYLSDQSIIMQPEHDLLHSLLSNEKDQLEPAMERNVPILRFENTHIRSYKNNKVSDVSMILVRNSKGVSSDSFLFRNNLYSKIWLELWSEPLYRTFKRFQSEEEVLGHMLQWHSQFLQRTAIISPKLLASVAIKDTSFDDVWNEVMYNDHDFVAVISCDFSAESCKREFQQFWNTRGRIPQAHHKEEDGPHGQNIVQNQVQEKAQGKAQEKAEAAAKANQ